MKRSRYAQVRDNKGLHVEVASPVNGILRRMADTVLHDRVVIRRKKNGVLGTGTTRGPFTEQQVRDIRRRFGHDSCAVLAAEFRVHKHTIYQIASGLTYGWVKP